MRQLILKSLWPAKVSLLLILFSCAQKTTIKNSVTNGTYRFNLTDINGSFLVQAKNKINDQKYFSTEKRISNSVGDFSKFLEKTISISTLGSIKVDSKNLPLMRIKASTFETWLEGEKYVSKMRLNPKKKLIEVVHKKTSEKKWNEKRLSIKNTRSVLCFFNQLVDCIKRTSFFSTAAKAEKGSLKLSIVFESYPYGQYLYENLPGSLLIPATISYITKEKGLAKYELDIPRTSMYYYLNDQNDLMRFLWPAQGITMESDRI